MTISITGAFVYQPPGLFDVVLVVVDDEGSGAMGEGTTLSIAVVLSYPDLFGQQVPLTLVEVIPRGDGVVRVGAAWPEGPEPPEGWAPAALVATVTSGNAGYSAVITAALPAAPDSGIRLVTRAPGPVQRAPGDVGP
jgi:hypothetical protein